MRTALRSLLGALASAVVLSGCGGLDLFAIEAPIEEQTVMGSPVGGALGTVVDIPLNVNLEQETEARDAGPVDAVTLTSLTLRITETEEPEGDDDDFDFLDAADVFVESRQAGSELPRERVAQLDPVPDGQRTIAFETFEDVNLKPYIEQGAKLTSSASGSAPPDDVSFAGMAVLQVEVL
jgi:hypothetical protein